MNQYSWNTLYPINQTILPLAVTLVLDERSHVRGQGTSSNPDTTQGESPSLLSYYDRLYLEVNYTQLIPKPPGQAGSLSRGGYSLEAQLNWQPGLYSTVQVTPLVSLSYCPVLSDLQNSVRLRLRHYLEAGSLHANCPISRQPPGIIALVQEEVSQKQRLIPSFSYSIFRRAKNFLSSPTIRTTGQRVILYLGTSANLTILENDFEVYLFCIY